MYVEAVRRMTLGHVDALRLLCGAGTLLAACSTVETPPTLPAEPTESEALAYGAWICGRIEQCAPGFGQGAKCAGIWRDRITTATGRRDMAKLWNAFGPCYLDCDTAALCVGGGSIEMAQEAWGANAPSSAPFARDP